MIIKLMHFEGFSTPFFAESFDDALAYVRAEITDDMRYGIYYETKPRYDSKGINGCPIWEISQIRGGEYGYYHWQIWEVTATNMAQKFAEMNQIRKRRRAMAKQRKERRKKVSI